MKQVLQSLKNGRTAVEEIPVPSLKPGHVLIQTQASVISPGTERMLLQFGKANLIDKARQQPEKVKQVFDKMKTDGVLETLDAVSAKMSTPIPLGYSSSGIVLNVGEGVTDLAAGDWVVSNGAHAQVVCVPRHLCTKLNASSEHVSFEEAAFSVLASIALQGVRLTNPTLGENIVVMGLGLLGLITVQLLKANGCRVLGIDFAADRLALAKEYGAEVVNLGAKQDPVAAAMLFSQGKGVDGVIITTATDSSVPAHQAAAMSRKRGRIVLVGVAGLELNRADFYEKELSFQVSCSYGPGRYDPEYETQGKDYPLPFVRWTENRNLQAVAALLAEGKINFSKLISHRFSIDQAENAYALLNSKEPALGIVLGYPKLALNDPALNRRLLTISSAIRAQSRCTIGMIGAGSFASKVTLPGLKKLGATPQVIASEAGVSSTVLAKRFGISQVTTQVENVFNDPAVNTVVVCSRHDTHAAFTLSALKANKHVFVEKPLAVKKSDVTEIEQTYAQFPTGKAPLLMIGFNRRFAPHVTKMKSLLQGVSGPRTVVMTVNAGNPPLNHWTRDARQGGRLIGEACHFLDLVKYLVGSPVKSYSSTALNRDGGDDSISICIQFEDGSMGTVHYLANGHRSFPKEQVQVYAAGRVLFLDNFRKLTGYGWPDFKRMYLFRQDKGHRACLQAFVKAVEGGTESPIAAEDIFEISRMAIELAGGKD